MLSICAYGRYIDEDDLFRFMSKEEVDNMLPLFEGAVETGKIKRKTLKNWLVNLYHMSFSSQLLRPGP